MNIWKNYFGDDLGAHEEEKVKTERKKVRPFKHEKSDIYQYFDPEVMTREIIFYEDDVNKARELVTTGEVKLTDVHFGYPNLVGDTEMMGQAYGETAKGTLYINFSKDRIEQATCYVRDCRSVTYYGSSRYYSENGISLCVHEIALLFLLSEYLKKENYGDATDSYANEMLYGFRKKRSGKVFSDSENTDTDAKKALGLTTKVSLEPFLEQEYDELKVGFKIVTDKSFALQKMENFIFTVENGETWKLGTKSFINFALAEFTEISKTYYDFIKNIVLKEYRKNEHDKNILRNGYRYYEPSVIKDRIPLYGDRIDTFFDLMNGKSVPVTIKKNYSGNIKTVWKFLVGNPKIDLKITSDKDTNNVFHGIKITGNVPKFIEGLRYKYFVDDFLFYRVDAEGLEEIAPLFKKQEEGKVSLKIGRRYLSEFYYRVLPIIKKHVNVTEEHSEIIHEYLPPEAEFNFMLDAEGGIVYCTAEAFYGEKKFNLTDRTVKDQKRETFRDGELEYNVVDVIHEYFAAVDYEAGTFVSDNDSDHVYNILKDGVSRLLQIGTVSTTDSFKRLSAKKSLKINIGVSLESGLLNLEVGSTDFTQEELLEILASYKKKKKYHVLKSGSYVDLENESLNELKELIDAMQISPKEFVKGKMTKPLYRALYLDKMLEKGESIYSERDVKFKQLVKNFKTVEDSDFEVPQSLKNVLRKYQEYGYRWLSTLSACGFGGILADDMGLGKTLQVITFLLTHQKKDKRNNKIPSLIVTPASLCYNWKEEFAHFAPAIKVCLVTGTAEERKILLEAETAADVFVTSYDLLKRDIDLYEEKQFFAEVIDEAQYIKNHTTAAAKSVKLISAKVKFALTGTPIENRLSELWSIFDYLMPGFLYTYDTFKKEIETPVAKYEDKDATEKLKKMVSPFILRRLKNDVLKDLPDKLEENYYAVMSDKQQKLYDGQVVKMKKELSGVSEDNFKKNKLLVLAELTRIRQICCDPGLLFENYTGESAKREVCLQLIENAIAGDHKILLFSCFTSMLAILEHDLTEKDISYYKITGETPKEKRIEYVNSFNTDNVPVFLISLKAGGTGLNLTGADIVIHYDPWWNVAAQNQATDRAHRIGQTKTVSVYRLIVKNSIEEKILKMQDDKKNLADAVLNGEGANFMDMTKEDLLSLIG